MALSYSPFCLQEFIFFVNIKVNNSVDFWEVKEYV